MPGPNRRYGSFAQTGGGRWTAAFAHLLPARPERDLVVELRRHAVVATCLLTFCMLFGGARVRRDPHNPPLCLWMRLPKPLGFLELVFSLVCRCRRAASRLGLGSGLGTDS